jgi:hypothetical protein
LVMAAIECLGGTKRMPLGAALGLAAGTGLGMWSRGTLALPGDSSWSRLPWLALVALAVGLVARAPFLPGTLRWVLRALAAAGSAWWLFPVEIRTETVWLAPALAAVMLALWALLEPMAARPPGGSVPLVLALAAFTAAGVLIHAGSARLTDIAVVLSASLCAIALVAWLRGGDAGGAVPGAALLLPGLVLIGQQETFSEVHWLAFALPAFAPFALVLTLPLRGLKPATTTGNRQGLWLGALRLVLVLIPLVAALMIAMAAGPLEFE